MEIKKEFYSSKQAISLDSVDLDKIVASNKLKINEKTYKYLCGYLNNDATQPLVAKLKIFNRINRTTFNNNNIPIERNHYICIPAIDIDSVLKMDNKRAYPQAYLEQCKYKLKKRKIVNYINDEIIDEDSDSDIDDAVDSHLIFSVPDSYVKI